MELSVPGLDDDAWTWTPAWRGADPRGADPRGPARTRPRLGILGSAAG
ncbi:hypothetical protein [Micromonospora ureilytica]|nr:hypothetical protein [Micromonospora ureilytica]